MIYAEYLSEEPVKYSCRENGLPETDEVESERYASERLVLLDSLDDSLAYIFRLQDRDYSGLYAVEHAGIYIVWCDCGEMYVALHVLQLDAYGI